MRFSTLVVSSFLIVGLAVACDSDSGDGCEANARCASPDGEGGDDGGSQAATSLAKVIGPDGGEISINGATLTLPPGALPADTEIRLELLSETEAALLAEMPAGISARSHPVAMTPHGLTFDAPVHVALGFSGTSASSLAAGRLSDPEDDAWEKAGKGNAYENGKATFTITSFSIYAIVDDPDGHLDETAGSGGTGGTTSAGGAPSSGGTGGVGTGGLGTAGAQVGGAAG